MYATAVQLSNVNFYYTKKKPILDDINVKVPYGKIYSLLGPSGAGKTTLLRLILGRLKVNSGEVKVLGDKPGVNNRIIGYMPQDQALCKTFTVGQTLQYFANIYRLSPSKFIERKKHLQDILGLPEDGKKISELSGGQQKVVSLSVTFLQHSKLMILDEPTVGSDPTLGDYIWKYLHLLCSRKNIVIIVVTHYIEEAGRGHITGIMRDGRMLEEGDPNVLIKKYQQKTLENVFLCLCMENSKPLSNNESMVMEQSNIEEIIPNHKINDEEQVIKQRSNQKTISIFSDLSLNFWILFVLIHKNLSRFFQLNITFLVFLIPAFQALILGLMYDVDEVAIPVAVYNQEIDPYYSQKVLDSIQKVDVYYLKPIQYGSLDLALKAIEEAKVAGVMTFDSDFTESLISRVVEPDSLSNDTLKSSNIKVYLDNTNFLFANGFVDSLRQTVYNFLGQVHDEQNLTIFKAPITLREVIYAKDSKLSDYLLPGYLIAFIYLSQVTISSQLLIQEKKEGLFERSLVAGVSHDLVLLSHFFSSFVLCIIQIVLMLYVSLFIFDIVNYGPIWLVFILVLTQALSAVATGLFISAIVHEGSTATLISIFITFSQVFSSGAIFPKELVRKYMQEYIYLTPIGLPSESLRNVMLKAWYITHPRVYNGILVNVLSTILLILLSSFTFKRNS